MPRSVETVGGESMMEEVVQLTKEERLAVKPMWSEIFYEDSDRFTDYYFAEKMPGNKGYGVKVDGELVSMMFLTPYPVWIKTGGAEDHTGYALLYRRRRHKEGIPTQGIYGLHVEKGTPGHL